MRSLGAVVAVLCIYAGGARAAYPGTNGRIAFLQLTTDVTDPPAEHLQVWTSNSDGTAAQQLTSDGSGNSGNADHPVWSPDGTKIAYVDGDGHVIVINAAGSGAPVDVSNTTDPNITDDWPTWSPDGTKIAFVRINYEDSTPEFDIVVRASDGSGPVTNLTPIVDTNNPISHIDPAWSPDGSRIAFVEGNPQQIWVMSAATGADPHPVTTVSDDAESPGWSPDGSKIVFDAQGVLYTTNPNAASPGQTVLANSPSLGDRNADYSPDGAKLVEQGVATSGFTNPAIWILNADGSHPTRVTSATYADQPSWQPTAADHLTVTAAGSGGGTVTSSPAGISCPGTCAFPYAPGTHVTLTATPGAGSYFAGWSGGGCSGPATCTVTLGADTAVTATFNAGYTLTVKPSPDLGMEVRSVPAGIDCETGSTGTCSAVFAPGSFVTLSQNAYQNGALFTGWTGGGCTGIGTCTVQMTGAKTIVGAWTFIAPHATGTHTDGMLAFSGTGTAAYVGTEWTGYLSAISCSGASLCVAAGYMTDSATSAHKGIVSTNTSFGYQGSFQAGVPTDFSWAPPGDQFQLEDVSCPSTSFCGAVDDQGDAFTTTNPSKGANSFGPNPQGIWQRAQNLDPIGNYSYHYTVGISCPSTGVCGIIDADGGLVSSTNTAGGAGTWSRQGLPGGGSPTDISCPSRATCYVTTALGDVLKSITSSASSTAAFNGAWTVMHVDPGGELDRIYCLQGDCFAVDHNGNIWSSTHPADGASAWKHVNLGSQFLTGISCSSTSFCVAVDNNGNAFVSKNPTGGASDWTSARVAPYDGLGGVSCTSALVHNEGNQIWCVAIAWDGKFVEGTIPLLGVNRQGFGSGSVASSTSLDCGSTCSALVPAGTKVTLTATPATGSAFSTWSSNCASTQSAPTTCTITLDQPFTTLVAAVFSKTPVNTGGSVTLGASGGTVTLQCTAKVLCNGSAALTTGISRLAHDARAARKPAKTTLLGTGTFRIKPHRRGQVRIHLTATGKAMVKHRKLHTVRLTLVTKQPHHRRLVTVRSLPVRY